MLRPLALLGMLLALAVPAVAAATTSAPGVTPSITLVSATPTGSTVTVKVRITGLKLAPALVGKAPKAGFGHWHIYVDGKYNNAVATLTGKSTKLKPGAHRIRVELANNDHSSLKPRVVSRTVTVHTM